MRLLGSPTRANLGLARSSLWSQARDRVRQDMGGRAKRPESGRQTQITRYPPSMVKNARKHTDAPRTTGRGPKPPVKCISERGRKFVSLVLESRQSQAISSRDATYYLGTDLKHTKALEDMLY